MLKSDTTKLPSIYMLESMTKVYENREGLLKNKSVLKSLNAELDAISKFLSLDATVAAVLSVLVCDQLMSDKTPIRKLMKYMGCTPAEVFQLNETMKQLKRKGWLELRERSLDRMSSRFESVEITKLLMDALHYNDASKLNRKEPAELGEALMLSRYFIIQTIGDYEIDEFGNVIYDFISGFKQFELLRELVERKDLNTLEKTLLVWVIIEYYQGKDFCDFNEVLELFLMDPVYCSNYKKKIIHGRSSLFSKGYIVFHKNHLTDLSEVVLSEEIRDALDLQTERLIQRKQRFRKCVLIEPEDTSVQTLFFNTGAKEKMEQIQSLLSEEHYQKVLRRFEKQGMKPSLTILLYGKPGTGKTEFVKQVARLHNRSILQVDISSVKDMWVGESEKNLKKVFSEYALALKRFPVAPILLFNEADAIIGQRTKVSDSVDQMLNTMQNILLQELEDFKGIFIATSNLVHNMDSAFDRRILYKNKLDLPDENTRVQIMRSNFPDLELERVKKIANKYHMSGAQIQNIKKKFIADSILFDVSDFEIEKYIADEVNFRQEPSNTIGYVNY